MTTQDISRHLLQPGKHYSAARMQQGRPILDSDWNEDAMLEAEDWRATLAELTGGHGSPNAGFSISNVHAHVLGLSQDFTIAPGSMYVGGLRVELEQPEQFFEQADRLRFGAVPDPWPMGTLPEHLAEMPDGIRHDLVYLHVWEQTVSMVEDRELRERPLGGPDTTTHVRRMRRVEVLSAVGTDHAGDAFAVLVNQLESEGGTFDHGNAELVSDARIKVQAIVEDSASPCGPRFTGGYIGNEHQAIRVELRSSNTFTWGFGNAAPLYRVVRVGPANAPDVLEFVTPPRDEAVWPRAGQIVEVLPWSARLANGEYVADLQGPLLRITNVQDRRITLDSAIPWASTAGMVNEGGLHPHFYLRIWDRGPDTTSLPEIPFQENVAVPLGYTGLQVTFQASGRIGDHWVLAARKGVNARLLPWELLDGAAPHGTRHFYAPLALVRWKVGEDPEVRDIRRRLVPLCERGCCTISVGDGETSFGQVDSLAAAVDLLPTTGGRICLLPGRHAAAVEIVGRSNIEIVGCGPDSVLVNASPVIPGGTIYTSGAPLLLLTNCTDIVLRNFAVHADASPGVKIDNATGQSERIRLEHLHFSLTGDFVLGTSYAPPQAGVLALGCNDLVITDCRVDVEDVLNYAPALVVGGAKIRIHRNWIGVGDLDGLPTAMGGIQVLSQSSDVELVGNTIRRGWGNGVTLGHVFAVAPPATSTAIPLADIWTAGEQNLGEALTHHLNCAPIDGAPMGTLIAGQVWCPLGAITGLQIRDNSIREMSLSGIASVFSTSAGGLALSVVIDAEIQGNDLVNNARNERLNASVFDDLLFALGGIVLTGSINASIRENVIRENGPGHQTPVCGISSLAAQNLTITDNRIIDNGALPTSGSTVPRGQRGGICVLEVCGVRGYTFADCKTNLTVPAPTVELGRAGTALFVHRNEVSQRVGKALWVMRGFGPIVVTENSLHSMGDPVTGMAINDSWITFTKGANSRSKQAQGACVEILNFATSSEVTYSGTMVLPIAVDPGATDNPDGRVLFNGNHTKLVWSWPGGYPSSVLITTLDSIVVDYNTMTVSMGNSLSLDGTFIAAALTAPHVESHLFFNCWLGASSTIQVTGNRFEEGLADAFLSCFAGDAIPALGLGICVVKNALLGTMNVGTHCIIGKPTFAGGHAHVFNNNLAIHHIDIGSFCTATVTLTAAGPTQFMAVGVP
jgi:hypothetical protein